MNFLKVGNNVLPIKTLGNKAIRVPIIVRNDALGDLGQSELDSFGQSFLPQCNGTQPLGARSLRRTNGHVLGEVLLQVGF